MRRFDPSHPSFPVLVDGGCVSLLRFLVFSHVMCNFDKIIGRLIFMFVYAYVVSVAFAMLHDGWKGLLLFREPVHLINRAYVLIKWYLHNKEFVSYGRCVKLFLVALTTLMVQWYLFFNLQWSKLPQRLLSSLRKLRTRRKRSVKARCEVMKEISLGAGEEILEKKDGVLSTVDESLNEMLNTIMSGTELSKDDLRSMKKSSLIKISGRMDDFMRSALRMKDKKREVRLRRC
ncbi:MAG: hypothetical protein ACTJLK_01230 [Anaplasma sp.]